MGSTTGSGYELADNSYVRLPTINSHSSSECLFSPARSARPQRPGSKRARELLPRLWMMEGYTAGRGAASLPH